MRPKGTMDGSDMLVPTARRFIRFVNALVFAGSQPYPL